MKRFGTSKFLSFLLPGTIFVAVGFVNRLVDSVIVGHVIGEDAFAGVNTIAPIFAGVTFVARLVAIGMATNYSIWMGRMDRRRAGEFFMQGLWMALILGGALSALIWFGGDAYFSVLNAAEFVEMYGRQYLDWAWPLAFLQCLLAFLSLFCCVDGDFRLCAACHGIVLLLNVGISYLAVAGGYGASGCAMGSIVAEVVGTLILCAHFFRKVNTLSSSWHFSLKDCCSVFRASFGDAVSFLCDGILFFVLAKLIILRFDCDMMPVAATAIFLWFFKELFDGIGVAVQPLVAVYWGELNVRAIRKVMQAAFVAAAEEAILLTGIVLFNQGRLVIWLVGIEGLEYPELLAEAHVCASLVCLGFVPLALSGLLKSYYLFVERPVFSLLMTLACYLVFPLAGITVGSSFGLRGLWIGLGVSPYLGLLVVGAVILLKGGRRGFPLLLPQERLAKTKVFDLRLTESEIVDVSRKVSEVLPPAVAPRASLMVEEAFMTVRERNPPGRRLRGEVTLDFSDGIIMTLRDDGVIFDMTDANAKISSLRAYLVASVMERQMGRLNLVTTGFNRNVFRLA